MAGYRIPGPLCITTSEPIDSGTLCLSLSHTPGTINGQQTASLTRSAQDDIWALEVISSNFAVRFIPDAQTRSMYLNETKSFARALQQKLATGSIGAQEAAIQAQQMRNVIMNSMRGRTSDFGLALAEFMKKEGKTLAQLEEKYADELFRKTFSTLAKEEQCKVWIKIVEKSGQPQRMASVGAKVMGHVGRGLFALTAVVAVYHVATAEDKVRASGQEISTLGGGLAGAAVLGSAGGICGPAAIACVPIGVVLGGLLGAAGAEALFDKIWRW
jgi:ribosomal protein L18E